MKVGPVTPGALGAQGRPPGKTTEGSFAGILRTEMEAQGLKLSAHARKRLAERRIDLGSEDYRRLNQAIDQAKAKGVKETLLVYGDIALVASVENRTVVTAVEGGADRVFTNIDGAVIVPR